MDIDLSTIEFFSVGDLIGQAVRLCWRNLKMILQVLLLPAIGCMVGRICMHWPFTFFGNYSSLLTGKGHIPDLSWILFGVVLVLGGLALWFYCLWIMMLKMFALVRLFLVDKAHSAEASFADAYTKIKSSQWAIFAIFTLGTLVSLIVTIAWAFIIVITALATRLHMVPAWILGSLIIAEVIGMLLTVILISIVYLLAYNDIILEGENIQQATARAWLLIWPNFWRILGFILLSVLVIVLITWPLSLPFVALSFIEMFVKGTAGLQGSDLNSHIHEEVASFGSKAPFYRLVLAQAWETTISMFTGPINLFAWAFFYQDLKKRNLALDLEQKLEELKMETETSGGQFG